MQHVIADKRGKFHLKSEQSMPPYMPIRGDCIAKIRKLYKVFFEYYTPTEHRTCIALPRLICTPIDAKKNRQSTSKENKISAVFSTDDPVGIGEPGRRG